MVASAATINGAPMPALRNQRWERYCQGLMEGKTSDRAHSDAGFAPNRGNASRMKANENIISRVAELQAKSSAKAELSAQMVIEGLLKEARREDESASHSARISAWGLLAKHLGMLIDRKIIGIKRLEDMGDDELRLIAGEVVEELDALVAEEGGEARPVKAELLGPAG